MQLTRRRLGLLAGASLAAGCTPRSAPAAGRRDAADVIVIGAGLSGMNAARMLAGEGMNVLVLEAGARAGGRILTLDDVPGRPEGGGQQVGQTYARIRKTARDLGVNIIAYPSRPRDLCLAVGNRVMASGDWAQAAENPFPEGFRPLPPSSALLAAAAANNPFEDNYAWRGIAQEKDISADAFLTGLGFDEAARKLIDISLNGNRLTTYAIANIWRSLTLYAQDASIGASERLEGGSSRLTEAMAASLADGSLRLNTPVREINERGDHVEVRTDAGSLTAPFAICTLPFPVLRNSVSLEPARDDPATALRRAAIKTLAYTQIIQVHVVPETRFWEADGLAPEMWTDTSIERVFANYDETGEIASLTAWINGGGAVTGLSDDAWFERATGEFQRLRQARVRGVKVVRWTEAQTGSGGAYMHWQPGEISAWAETMGAPSGRIHFAGEHLSNLHTGMEGAMESGERAAYDILAAAAR